MLVCGRAEAARELGLPGKRESAACNVQWLSDEYWDGSKVWNSYEACVLSLHDTDASNETRSEIIMTDFSKPGARACLP